MCLAKERASRTQMAKRDLREVRRPRRTHEAAGEESFPSSSDGAALQGFRLLSGSDYRGQLLSAALRFHRRRQRTGYPFLHNTVRDILALGRSGGVHVLGGSGDVHVLKVSGRS